MNRPIPEKTTPALKQAEKLKSDYSLEHLGFRNLNNIYWNLSVDALYKEAEFRSEGKVSKSGPLLIDNADNQSCTINDKFIVHEAETENYIDWGLSKRPFSTDKFEIVYYRMLGFLQKRDLFIQDGFAGSDPNYHLPIRVITENAWQSLFAKNMLNRAESENDIRQFVPEFTIISVPSFQALPEIDGTVSEAFVIINFERKLILIGGTASAGDIRNAISTVMNYLLPHDNILTMHCSANVGDNQETALFFGDLDTSKMTLISDPNRQLIGDNFIGWSDEGIFYIEGGLYSRLQSLSADKTPDRFACTQKFGTILENSESPDGRLSCPLQITKTSFNKKTAGHPKNIFIMICDTLGVLPLVSKLTADQMAYHYLSGYSSIINNYQPEMKFNSCFGDDLLVHPPNLYAERLTNKIKRHKTNCWLINTGWIGGQFGFGKRIEESTIKAILNAIMEGKLAEAKFSTEPVFRFDIPKSCDGVPAEILDPSESWADKETYEASFAQLAGMYIENYKKFTKNCPTEIVNAGPVK